MNTSKHTHHFFAFDLGATSGRSILATLSNNKLELKELTRFPNKIIRIHDKYYWDILALFDELKNGLKAASSIGVNIDAIGIDTWGVDFVFLGGDGTLLSQPRSYRDPYTNGIPEEYFKIISKEEVYNLTGIQIMNFNSLFQIFAAKKENFAALNSAKDLLFMPDALSYMLTGKKICEYTIASTSQLLNPKTKKTESKLLEAINVDPSIIQSIVMPGQVVGCLLDSVAKECDIKKVPVIAVAGHDTASAVVAVPAQDENFAYLSSGTWSLMGIEVKEPIINIDSFDMNFTNEGGVEGTTRFLKNITGMWLLEQCRKEWENTGKIYTYPEIVAMSESVEGFQSLIDPDHSSFANPDSMIDSIISFCRVTDQKAPYSDAEFIRCIFDSLALKYRYVLECLQKMAPFKIEKLHVIGGGSQNNLLNQATANSIGIPVVAGPREATAIGNVMIQAKGLGLVSSLHEIRQIINNSITTETFYPQDTLLWQGAYNRFIQYIK
ncbi:rhamnulokinase [Dysgonomonas sp. Marseille-P4677]|uniref:rhamnulokinase n=1 Tax=Dysgonomonas sp. Marseille-P4677 TaxID=2364790 RepID=UPI0019139119|nr:rhamnulokinase family protein [Dysgonomonas sp. Marseille-P4677]MBK5719601.1 rhamnulokinase [Dysgonomonas sp. Marseille-P4677]